jgi:Concanavalin A-like lectin/glucanases superfamily/Immunoglobulin domain/HYR domain
VTVVDTTAPTISCPSNIVVMACTNVQEFYTPTASDTCCGNIVPVCTPPSGSYFAPGTVTTVHCVATDCSSNQATCDFTVTVQCCVPPPTNMVLWLPLDETSGTTSANLASPANFGTQINGPVVLLGAYVANSLAFNGVNQRVSVPDYPAINPGTGDLSIDAWVNRATNSGNGVRVIVDKRDVPAGIGYALSVSFGNLIFTMSNNNFRDTGTVPADGQWHFVAVTVNRTTSLGQFYVDGNTTGTFTPIAGNLNNTNLFLVGASFLGGNSPWLGYLDEVEVFNRALATNEVVSIFNAGTQGKCKPSCDGLVTVNCTTNKAVQCGSSWFFDPPTATSCCGTNVTITPIGLVTNPVCPKTITQTWLITDACGHSNTCSQIVTNLDNTAPVITSVPTGINLGCNPTLFPSDLSVKAQVTATDSCSSVTIHVSHLDGGTPCNSTRTFTITATDACGNNSAATNVVYSWTVDTTPPTLTRGTIASCYPTTVAAQTAALLNTTVTDNCSPLTSMSIISFTVGTCSAVVTVKATDACGNSASITYNTKIDPTPPSINCLSNTLVVALDTNCNLVIPSIRPPATDGCTPASQLVYTQSPLAGQVVTAHSQTVTVTVTDLCGNSNQCSVLVVGQDRTAPLLTCPASITVTNCLVPNAQLYVSATDNCCAQSQLHFTQSPAAGGPIGPGVTSVTITVTDCNGNSTSKVIPLNIIGSQSFLANLFNTGVTNDHTLLPNGEGDSHYLLPAGAVPAGIAGYPGYAVATTQPWDLVSTASKWIAPFVNSAGAPGGNYTYTQTFSIPAGADLTSASISGRWAVDNFAGMYLNGHFITSIATLNGWGYWRNFTIPPGNFLTVNTLSFVVTNTGGYTGLRVELTNAVVNCYTCAPPVIISISGSQTLPRNGTAVFQVNAGGTPPLSYQWYHNGLPLSNNGHDSGVTSYKLTIWPLNQSDGGTYTVVITNPCGSVTGRTSLRVRRGWPWLWAWWNVAQLDSPLAASVGPDLTLVGTNYYAIAAGTTEDLGLSNPGGQIVNVLHVPALPVDTTIQLPFIAPPGSNTLSSYSVFIDVYLPSSSSNTVRTLFSNLGTNGQDGFSWTIDASNHMSLTGTIQGITINPCPGCPPPFNLTLDGWNRLALVIDDPQDGVGANLSMYFNGQPAGTITQPILSEPVDGLAIETNCPSCPPPPTVLSSTTGNTGELYTSGIQFHTVALTPEMIAGLGSPNNGPLLTDVPSMGPPPLLSTTVSNGVVNFTWTGSPYVLQETADLATHVWVDSGLPFDESEVNGDILTVTHANPAAEGTAKFYRLIYAP